MNNRVNPLLDHKNLMIIGIFSLAVPGLSLAQMGGMSRVRGTLAQQPVVSVSGGVSGFQEGAIEDLSDQGASWDVRGLWSWDEPVGLELAYFGSTHDLDSPTLGSTTLAGNGLEAAARWHFVQGRRGVSRDGSAQPYLLAGAAWKNYQRGDGLKDPNVLKVDDLLEVPLGAGVSYYFAQNFVVDARAAYRFAFLNDLIDEGDDSLDNWNVAGRVGYLF